MKRIVFTALIVAISFATVNAQETVAAKSATVQNNGGLESLNLTTDQKEKIASIRQAHKLEIEALKKEGASAEKIESLRQSQDDQILAILTKEQRAELSVLRKKELEAANQQQTNVTVEQKKAILAKEELAKAGDQKQAPANAKEEMAAKMKAIQNDASLTETQKKDKIKELMQQYKDGKNYTEEEKTKLPHQKKHTISKKTSN